MNDNSQMAIGRLEGKVDLILIEMARFSESRKEQYERLEQLTRNADETDRKIGSLEQRVTAIEPTTAEFRRWKERGIGAMFVVAGSSASLAQLAPIIWKKIATLFS